MKYIFSLTLFSALFFSCTTSSNKNYYASLKVMKEYDSTRLFDTTANGKTYRHFRPVKIDLFYPSAETPHGQPLSYGDILDMYEQRFDFNNPIDSCKKTSNDFAKSIAGYLHVDSASKILNYKTGIYTGLKTPEKKFPLVIYAAGMNGSTWENALLFQQLANNGYVVAAISSVGKFPGYMSEAVDMNEQVQDILFTIKKAGTISFIDTAKIGLLSWSLGGTAITKAAMLSNSIKCLLSFDGTEIHYYGADDDTAWDTEYNEIMKTAPSNPLAIQIPYLYLSSSHPKNIDSIYNLQQFVGSPEKYFLLFKGAIHEDFSSITAIAKAVQPNDDSVDVSKNQKACKLTMIFFNQYLKNKTDTTVAQYINELAEKYPALYTKEYPKK